MRPVIRAEARGADGQWVRVPFLVDTGADRTVFSAQKLWELGFGSVESYGRLGGVGGTAQAVEIETTIRFTYEPDGKARLPGLYAAFVELEALDMSVLGSDVLQWCALIVDRPGNVVCLLNQNHRYSISAV